jgi:hypothetical protein
VLVLVRNESGIERIPDLAGRSVSLGDEKTGLWLTSQAILGEYGVLSEIVVSPAEFTAIVEDDGPIAAIVTAKFDDRRLQAILQSGKVRAIPITRRVPALSEHVEDEEQPWLPRGGLRTLQTRAVLSVRSRTPDWFVKDCLEALYGSDIPHREGFFPLQSSWSNLNLHPAAEEFFDERAR